MIDGCCVAFIVIIPMNDVQRPWVVSLISFLLVLLAVTAACAQTEMKRVVGDNATLPCHHQFWVGDDPTLDIEWLLLKPTNRVVSESSRQKEKAAKVQ